MFKFKFKSVLKLKFFLFFLIFILCDFSAHAWDRATPSVDVSDSVYDSLDVLNAHKLIPNLMIGQRPFSRSEVARLLAEAELSFQELCKANKDYDTNLPYFSAKTKAYLQNLISELKKRFPTDRDAALLQIDALEKITLNTTFLNSTPRAYFGTGQISAMTNPLVQNNQGRHYVDGFQSALETQHSASLGSYFSVLAQPRLQLQAVNTKGSEENKFFLNEVYGTTSFFNTQIDVGRKALNWGQDHDGGMMFSNNARALDGVQVTNPTPWKIKFLGHFKYTFFFADLGPEQNFSGALLSGLKLSFAPIPQFELGFARAIIFGGSGAPDGSFLNMVGEFFGLRNRGQYSGGANLSNSISGFEMRGRIPQLRGLNLYSEFYFDDFTLQHMWRSLKQDSAILLGVYLPRLDDSGSLSLRIEGRKTTNIMYKHTGWVSGWTENSFIMGDPLGADAESFHVALKKNIEKYKLVLSNQFFFERIDSDSYGANTQIGRFVVVNGIPEWRVRDMLGVSHEFTDLITADLNLGYENVKNFNFVSSNSQNNFLIQAMLHLDTAGRFMFKK